MLLKLLIAAPAVLPIFSTLAYNMTISGVNFPTSNCDALPLGTYPAITFGNSTGSRFCAMNTDNDEWLIRSISMTTTYTGTTIGGGGNITAFTVVYDNENSTTIGTHGDHPTWVNWKTKEDYIFMATGYPPAADGEIIWSVNIATTNGTMASGGIAARGWSGLDIPPAQGVLLGVSGYTGAFGIESLTFYTRPARCTRWTYGQLSGHWDGKDCRNGQTIVPTGNGTEY